MFRRRPALPSTFPAGGLLVGGAARDILRSKTPNDYDWAVPDPAAAAQAMAQATGGAAFVLDSTRNYWRVSAPQEIQHDFVPLPPNIEDDLRRRDFTVNALALTGRGEVLDVVGGQADLRARRLRMVSAQNLRDDPLRAWRGVRLALTLGLKMETQTEQTIRQIAADLSAHSLPMPAAERIRDELHGLLRHPDAARGILRLDELGLLALSLPELLEGKGVQQGGFHHLDVYGHGVDALHQLLNRQPDAPLPLRWAALLHDIAKPRTAATDPQTGRRTFHGHDKLGAELTHQILTRLKLPGDDIAHAARLVGLHMVHLPTDEKEARRFVHRRREQLPDLLWLMLADREAARGPASTPASRHAYALGMERVLAALEDQPQAPAPLLTGGEIMALLGLSPGPQVGQAVRALAEAAALGEVQTPEQARKFVAQWYLKDAQTPNT